MAIIINFDSDGINKYEEMLSSLSDKGSYYYGLKKLYHYLKNRATPPSIEEPLVLELKAPPLTCDMYF